MPRPIPIPVRQVIWKRFCDGQDAPTIAAQLGLAPRTVLANGSSPTGMGSNCGVGWRMS